jgi:hypothetical protein
LGLVGVGAPKRDIELDLGGALRTLVLDNHTIFGTVNANRRHYEIAAEALARADPGWLRRLITRQVPVARWQDAMRAQPGDIKVVIEFENEA